MADTLRPSECLYYSPTLHGECELELMRIVRMRVRLGERSDWPRYASGDRVLVDILYLTSRRPALIKR